MTSNLGSQLIRERMEQINDANRDEVMEATRNEVMELLKKTIRPEFLNRIDELTMFAPLTFEQIKNVVRIQLNKLIDQLQQNNIVLKVTDAAVELLSHEGYNPEFGARPVKRVIQRMVLNELSKKMIMGDVNTSDTIFLDVKNGSLEFVN